MIASDSPSKVSVIIEWDNVRLSELDRAKEMLVRVSAELRDLHAQAKAARENGRPLDYQLQLFASPVEFMILFPEDEFSEQELREILAKCFEPESANARLAVVGGAGCNYYKLKNKGVRQAQGELIVFVDSDVIPESHWLQNLTRPFNDPSIQVVCGNTYLDADSLYSRIMALSFFFPLRMDDGPLSQVDWFFANNVAFRRDVLVNHPFPERTDQFRGQCDELARALKHAGIAINLNPAARCCHPPPNGLRHFVNRAICEGHDFYLEAQHSGQPRERRLRASFGRARRRGSQAWQRIRQTHGRVGLSATAVPAAMGVAFSYYSLYLVGELLARTSPGLVRRCFSI